MKHPVPEDESECGFRTNWITAPLIIENVKRPGRNPSIYLRASARDKKSNILSCIISPPSRSFQRAGQKHIHKRLFESILPFHSFPEVKASAKVLNQQELPFCPEMKVDLKAKPKLPGKRR